MRSIKIHAHWMIYLSLICIRQIIAKPNIHTPTSDIETEKFKHKPYDSVSLLCLVSTLHKKIIWTPCAPQSVLYLRRRWMWSTDKMIKISSQYIEHTSPNPKTAPTHRIKRVYSSAKTNKRWRKKYEKKKLCFNNFDQKHFEQKTRHSRLHDI